MIDIKVIGNRNYFNIIGNDVKNDNLVVRNGKGNMRIVEQRYHFVLPNKKIPKQLSPRILKIYQLVVLKN
jgi:hypothetical protein